MSLWEFLLEILKNIRLFRVVYCYQYGVKFIFGKVWKQVDSGLAWNFPIIGNTQVITKVRQVVDLPNQCCVTQDGVCVAISGCLEYEIVDAVKALTNVSNLDVSIQALTMKYLKDLIQSLTWDDLVSQQIQIDDELKTLLLEWGVNVISVGLTHLTKHIAISTIPHTSVGEKN